MSTLSIQNNLLLPCHYDWRNAILGNSLFVEDKMTCVITANGQAEIRTTLRGGAVDLYRNLNRPGLFSCKQRSGCYKGKVSGYANIFVISDPKFVVSSASRQRTLNQNKRNVHAFTRTSEIINAFEGTLKTDALPPHKTVTYHPFYRGEFFNRITEETVNEHSGIAILYGANVYCLNRLV